MSVLPDLGGALLAAPCPNATALVVGPGAASRRPYTDPEISRVAPEARFNVHPRGW